MFNRWVGLHRQTLIIAFGLVLGLLIVMAGAVIAKRQAPAPIFSNWQGPTDKSLATAVFTIPLVANYSGATISVAPADSSGVSLVQSSSTPPAGDDYLPHGRPIDPTRSDWLITQNWQQHRINEGVNVGALDFAFLNNTNAVGSPLHATEPGVVGTLKDRGDGTGYGNAVYILGFINPQTGISYNTVYGHFTKVDVQDGQTVNRGDHLGEMGSTGFSTGPHVHYEVWQCQLSPAEIAAGIKPGATNPSHTECQNIDPMPFIGQ